MRVWTAGAALPTLASPAKTRHAARTPLFRHAASLLAAWSLGTAVASTAMISAAVAAPIVSAATPDTPVPTGTVLAAGSPSAAPPAGTTSGDTAAGTTSPSPTAGAGSATSATPPPPGAASLTGAQATDATGPIQLRIVGGLADVRQFTRYEAPFWTKTVPQITHGQVHADIAAFDRAGIRGEEMLQLMRLGVVPFGTILPAIAASDEPVLNGIDLPALSPDMATLKQTVKLWRPELQNLLLNRYNIQLLALYTYPAQVVFCKSAFTGLADLKGRRIRTSSVGQSEMFAALGAIPVITPYADIVSSIKTGVVECAITGTLSGNTLGLTDLMSHEHTMAITWGVSIFGANATAWEALPANVRDELSKGLHTLETQIWDGAEEETEQGLACNAGQASCTEGHKGHMVIVPASPADETLRRKLLVETVIPGWVQRCGAECSTIWNAHIGPQLGIWARAD